MQAMQAEIATKATKRNQKKETAASNPMQAMQAEIAAKASKRNQKNVDAPALDDFQTELADKLAKRRKS